MKTIQELRKVIEELPDMLEFEVNGKYGNIDCYYSPKAGISYLLYFDGYEVTVYSADEVMETPFIGGKSITDVFNTVTF